jgi:mono/diheme cytochrome c family protein
MQGRKLVVTVLAIGLGLTAYGQEKPKIKRVTAERTSPAAGPEMFKGYCAACHGTDGKGNGPAAAALTKQPADLTQLSKKNRGKFPALRVRNIILGDDIMAAHGSRDMPVWGIVFRSMGDDLDTQMRLQNLTAYLESLQQK